MTEERFIQLGDTHIQDTITGREWYAPCEPDLLDNLNAQEILITAYREFIDLKGLKKEFDVFLDDFIIFREIDDD